MINHTCCRANFPLFFRGLCEILITSLNDKITQSLKTNDKLEFWESSCKLLNKLLEILQGLDIPRNFQIFLKVGENLIVITNNE